MGQGCWAARWSGEGGAQPVDGFDDLGDPPPVPVDAQPGLPDEAGELDGGVQDAVAKRGDLAVRKLPHVREADQLGPTDQVRGGQHGLQPGICFPPGCGRGSCATRLPRPGGCGL